jgi:6-phospho-beta-glucosidase
MNPFSLCVLGGGSPFTVGLIDALRDSPADLAACRITLYGRDSSALSLLADYATRQLGRQGVQVTSTTQLDRALDGASVILHQIRYGGLALRQQAEELCARRSVPADETLGPGALLTALASLHGLHNTTAAILRNAPTAWVLNLTNPLSAITAMMHFSGISRCIGLCELPELTHQATAALLRVVPEKLSWSYSGLNHRGFLHDLSFDARDALPDLLREMQTRSLPGIDASDVRHLRAIPLKYFAGFQHPHVSAPGRAHYLSDLRQQVERQLAASVDVSPPALAARNQDWYPLVVVPVLLALCQPARSMHVVNIFQEGLVRETPTLISSAGVQPIPQPVPNERVGRWLEIFETHERHFLTALMNPSLSTVEASLAQDPLVPPSHLKALSAEVWEAAPKRDPRAVDALAH